MTLRQMSLSGTTETDGTLTVNGESVVFGQLEAVEWIDGTFDDGVDAVISVQSTTSGVGLTLLTLTNANDDAMYYPRAIVHSEAGAALTGTSGGDRTKFVLSGKPRLVVTAGGNAKTGGCILYYT
jgi:hypothetical protein